MKCRGTANPAETGLQGFRKSLNAGKLLNCVIVYCKPPKINGGSLDNILEDCMYIYCYMSLFVGAGAYLCFIIPSNKNGNFCIGGIG